MKTIRELVGKFIYEHMERMTELVAQGGPDVEMDGIVCLQERSGFTQGALIENAMYLFIHYNKTSDERTEESLRRVHYFISFIEDMQVKTWGKLAILRGLAVMNKEGLLDRMDPEKLALLKEKTDYTDFLDKETLELNELPSNYYHVAMACAGYREQLGWEVGEYSQLCLEKLMDIMKQKSQSGWMDEEVPYGRFDRYSMMIASELTDTLDALKKNVPEFVLDNLKAATDVTYCMVNETGEGVTYGRSLSVHGDSGPVEILSTAFKHDLVEAEKIDEGMCYCVKSLEKVLGFWYRNGIFDIWNDGRTTNGYRQKHRILEVNLDMTTHMFHILENMEAAGLADYRPTGKFSQPDSWIYHKIQFVKKEKEEKVLYILKRGADTFMLPLIGAGNLWKSAAYLPFPAKPMLLEAPPESYIPFLVPEVTMKNGAVAMPIQYLECIGEEEGEDLVIITAKGKMCRMDSSSPEAMEENFKIIYRFDGQSIEVTFEFDGAVESVRMEYAGNADVEVSSEAQIQILETAEDPAYFTPHGRLRIGKRWMGCGNIWKYKIRL